MDDKLSLETSQYTGNQLRIDGYYYNLYNEEIHNISFFYENGVTLNCGGAFSDFKEADDYIMTYFINIKKHQKSKINWGVYSIECKKIKIERWAPSQKPYRAYIRSGIIVNDSSFIINEIYRMDKGIRTEIRKINEIYYFKAYNPKPDSTNSYIIN